MSQQNDSGHSEDESEQEQHLEEDLDPMEFNWRRSAHQISEAADEIRTRFSALESSDFEIRLMLLYHEVLVNDAKRLLGEGGEEINGQSVGKTGPPLWSELDLDSDEDSFEIENSGHLAVSGDDVLSSEELASEENLGQPQTAGQSPPTNEMK